MSAALAGANGAGSGDGVVRGIRVGANALSTLADLELALNAAVHVNAALNEQIEAAVAQLARAEQERLAWEQHARRLAAQLARCKREAAAAAGGGGDDAGAQRSRRLGPARARTPPASPP